MAWRHFHILKGKQLERLGLGGLRRCSKHFIKTSSTLPGSAFALKWNKCYQNISCSLLTCIPWSSRSSGLCKPSAHHYKPRFEDGDHQEIVTSLMECLSRCSFYPPWYQPETLELSEPHSSILLSTRSQVKTRISHKIFSPFL